MAFQRFPLKSHLASDFSFICCKQFQNVYQLLFVALTEPLYLANKIVVLILAKKRNLGQFGLL